MDDYRAFRGTAELNEIKSRQDNNRLTEEDKTFYHTLITMNLLTLRDTSFACPKRFQTKKGTEIELDRGFKRVLGSVYSI